MAKLKIRFLTSSDEGSWDAYVHRHPDSTHCHLSGWKHVIENTYGHKAYYLLAEAGSEIVGLLPLFHIKSPLFRNQLVSMPFLDCGGVIADAQEAGEALVRRAVELGTELNVDTVELRQANSLNVSEQYTKYWFPEGRNRVRMVLQLPPSLDELYRSFKAKLRSQIRRPSKAGMTAVLGGIDLLAPFYDVFSTNMRDLGSPVHASKLFREVCKHLDAKVSIVYQSDRPVAAAIMILFKDTAQIPWASSLRRYNALSPNMLLYWSLLKYACKQGLRIFDFGRSTDGEGTYKFKQQWGSEPVPLHWRLWRKKGGNGIGPNPQRKFKLALKAWQLLPLPFTLRLGPVVRKYISL